MATEAFTGGATEATTIEVAAKDAVGSALVRAHDEIGRLREELRSAYTQLTEARDALSAVINMSKQFQPGADTQVPGSHLASGIPPGTSPSLGRPGMSKW